MDNEDLKTGMILECKNGDLAMVLKGTENGDIVSGDTWQPINPNRNVIDELDVVKIYQPQNNEAYLNQRSGFCKRKISTEPYIFGLKNYEVIWTRKEEKKEMTIGEIEKKLGYKIKIIKEEN